MMPDPWRELPPPPSATALSARRADEQSRAAFFWARDADAHCLLVLEHKGDFPSGVRIPSLRGIHISKATLQADRGQLLFRLEDAEQRDIFAELCRDIITAAKDVDSDESAVRVSLARTWRWFHLLKGGSGRALSEEKQKGLLGELLTLQSLATRIETAVVVDSWTGPLGEPTDFALPGSVAIECKAIRSVGDPFVQVSSEWQLDTSDLDGLYLIVADVTRSVASEPGSFTLTDAVAQARELVSREAPAALDTLDSKLFAAGYRPEDDYSEFWWEAGDLRPFAVTDDFPRIEASRLPLGVERVTYNVTLNSCAPFGLDMGEVLARLERADGP